MTGHPRPGKGVPVARYIVEGGKKKRGEAVRSGGVNSQSSYASRREAQRPQVAASISRNYIKGLSDGKLEVAGEERNGMSSLSHRTVRGKLGQLRSPQSEVEERIFLHKSGCAAFLSGSSPVCISIVVVADKRRTPPGSVRERRD
jgi:hypothetical protein